MKKNINIYPSTEQLNEWKKERRQMACKGPLDEWLIRKASEYTAIACQAIIVEEIGTDGYQPFHAIERALKEK